MDDLSKFVPDVRFEQIPIKHLVSNQNYQRHLSQKHIKKTVESFDIHQINPVKVSRRNGINYVFNGQHTIEIVATVSGSRETPVWCMVFEDMDYEVEADTFANQQKNVKPLLPFEIFKANLEAGNDMQLMIKALVESMDLVIGPTKGMRTICAISTIEEIYLKHGEFFIQAGAENVQEYITKDSQLTGFIRKTMGEDESEEKLPFSKYFEMLDDLIERRNVVAHGSEVDDLLSFDYLDQYAEYISLLMAPIYEALLYDYYCITIKANTVNTLGLPIKVFNNSIVCINSSHYGIKVGDTLIGMNSQGEIQWGAIQSIEIDGKRVQEVPSLQAVNVGVVVPFKAKDIYTYYHHPEGNP